MLTAEQQKAADEAQQKAAEAQAASDKIVQEKMKKLEADPEYKDVIAYIKKTETSYVALAQQVAQFTQGFMNITMIGGQYLDAMNKGRALAKAAQAQKTKEVASQATAHAAAAKVESKVEDLSKNVPAKEEQVKPEA